METMDNIFPFYTFPVSGYQDTIVLSRSILRKKSLLLVDEIRLNTGMVFIENDSEGQVCFADNKEVRSEFRRTFNGVDLLNYTCAVFHSLFFRGYVFCENEEIKLPIPVDSENFWKLGDRGEAIWKLLSLESGRDNNYILSYPVIGDNAVTAINYSDGQVQINNQQYFDKIEEVVWFFTIGNLCPAQQWLKERIGKVFNIKDILYYQSIIRVLSGITKVVSEIDSLLINEQE